MYGRNRVAPEKMDTIAILFCLFSMVTTEMGVVMKTKIYALRNEDRWLRYVGKTIVSLKHRMYYHLWEAQSKEINHRCNWIRSMLRKNLLPTITLIEEVEGDGCKEEIKWIKYFRDHGIKLVNSTNGGDGLIGWRASEKTKAKHRAFRHSEVSKQKISKAHLGMGHTEKTKQILREKAHKQFEDPKMRIRCGRKKGYVTPDYIQELRKTNAKKQPRINGKFVCKE